MPVEHPLERDTVGARVAEISGYLRHGGGALTAGDLATLRRMDPRRLETAFIKLATRLQLHGDEEQETRWAAIVVGLAILGELHQPGVALGRALAEAGYSELRFSRLLRADAERLVDELPALARFLAAKNVRADWLSAAWLILSADRSNEERTRRGIARDYFNAVAAKERA